MLALLALDLNVSPTSAGMPGAELISKLLSWLSQLALWGSLASILVGAAIYGLSKEGGHGYNATRGRSLAAGGAVGAVLAGLAPTVVRLLFQAAS
ncbi:MAG: hypothetical protein AB1679_11640 [Actinomycetota bacterium]